MHDASHWKFDDETPTPFVRARRDLSGSCQRSQSVFRLDKSGREMGTLDYSSHLYRDWNRERL